MKSKRSLGLAVFFLLLVTPSISYGMHIMEGFLKVEWAIFWGVLCIPFLVLGFKRLNILFKQDSNTKVLLGLAGGFVFVLSALKIPSVTGSCSHPTGVGLGAILFGPMVMSVLGSIVLLFQSILLAHGGLTTIGANVFSMAIVGPIVSYLIFKSLKNTNKGVAVFLAASIGDLVTYCVTALQLSLAFPDSATGFMGSLVKFLSVFAVTQVPLAIVEGLLTVMVYNLLMEYKEKGVISIENI